MSNDSTRQHLLGAWKLITAVREEIASGAKTELQHVTQKNVITVTSRPANKFIGVYSGRLRTQDPLDAQTGMVWSDTYIDEIIDGGLRDYG